MRQWNFNAINYLKCALCLIPALLTLSCEKVIDVQLNDSNSQIVIEGEITTAKGPYQVKISESKNFVETNDFPGRNDGLVMVKDLTSGLSETLKSRGTGIYETVLLQGMANHTYQMIVILGGKTYAATSTIPAKNVKLDDLYARPSAVDSKNVYMVPVFTDPAGVGNYYRIRQWVRGILVKGSYVRSDEGSDGYTYDTLIYYGTEAVDGNPLIANGDIITAELQCIDKNVFDFYRTLNTTIAQEVATPSNPVGNISGGALGVFNACRSVKVTAKAKF